ncbi:hypothetical protein F5144DRAFT_618869 [Chaetomium tenue]|uniref:Uncharacterized protein n=1 Tax=Chaetomium tenue TaxID=1854479 RepID=A0ACB7PKR9_9PEZI|nr:hypothetical protein F5144DRAFT_618869 [Chaetomium globosum]
MCGPETPSSTPRIGARVDLSSPSGRGSLGNLLFLNPTSPSSAHATHVRFFQPATAKPTTSCKSPFDDDSLLVSIHLTGDLTKPLADAGLMQQFTLRSPPSSTPSSPINSPHDDGVPNGYFEETALGAALSLQVGSDGIIGRRVSMRRGEELLADGIVGFNSLPVVLGGGGGL